MRAMTLQPGSRWAAALLPILFRLCLASRCVADARPDSSAVSAPDSTSHDAITVAVDTLPVPVRQDPITLRRVIVGPDDATRARLTAQLRHANRVRCVSEDGVVELRSFSLTTDGVQPGAAEAAPDSGERIPWSRVLRLERASSGTGRGAVIGAAVGVTPGIGIMLGGSELAGSGGSGAEFIGLTVVEAGIVIGLVGGAGGAVIGGLVGSGIPRWQAVYIAPQLWLANQAPGRCRRIAVGPIANAGAPRLPFVMISAPPTQMRLHRASEVALREAGFEVTPAESVRAVVAGALKRKPNPNDVRWVQDPEAMSALQAATGADAVLSGVFSSDRKGGGFTRCRYELRRLPDAELIAWSEVGIGEDAATGDRITHLAREGVLRFSKVRDDTTSRVAR